MLDTTHSAELLDFEIGIEPDFDFLSAEYRALFEQSVGAPFAAPLWLSMMHRRLAPTLGARQHTVAIRDPRDRHLLAVLPLVLQKSRGVTLLQPADFGLCDSNAPVGAPVTLSALAANTDAVARLGAIVRGADLFLYRKARCDGFDLASLFPHARRTPAENLAYHIEVEEDFDQWRLRVLRRHLTKELGRLGRQLEKESGAPYETRLATTPVEIAAAFDALYEMRHGQFEDDLLSKPHYFDFYRDYATAAGATGEALTYVSMLGNRPVAVLFGLASDDIFHALQLGHDNVRLGKYSLGLQVIYRTIRLRHGEGHRYFDMGLGNTGYKSHFRVEETRLSNFSSANNFSGAIVDLIYTRAKPLKNVLRRLTQVR